PPRLERGAWRGRRRLSPRRRAVAADPPRTGRRRNHLGGRVLKSRSARRSFTSARAPRAAARASALPPTILAQLIDLLLHRGYSPWESFSNRPLVALTLRVRTTRGLRNKVDGHDRETRGPGDCPAGILCRMRAGRGAPRDRGGAGARQPL